MNESANRQTQRVESPYSAFLVRCWFEGGQWRFFLETIAPAREKRGFSSVEALCDYVRVLLDETADNTTNPQIVKGSPL